jgi:hypothetical protein
MTIGYTIYPSSNLTVFTLSGQVSFAELTDALGRYGEEGPTMNELYDIRELQGRRLSKAEIERLVGYVNRYAHRRRTISKTAIVIKEDIDFGISRMIAMLSEGSVPYRIDVFRSMEKAMEWLKDMETGT